MTEDKDEEKEIKTKSNRNKSNKYICYVLQPFGVKEFDAEKTNFDAVYTALMDLESKIPTMPIELTRVDTSAYTKETLRKNLHIKLESADFCIADVTGNNPNVLYEIGFVTGIRGEDRIILITQDPESIPVNLNGLLHIRYDINTLENLATDIRQHLPGIKKTIDTAETSDHYDVEAYAKRSKVNFDDMFGKAKEEIDILQTNLVTIGTNYMNVLVNALEGNDSLNIKILTLDPQSQYVGVRAMQLGFEDIGVYRNELSSSLELVKTQFDKFEGRVKIRKYNDFPSQLTYIVDNEVVGSVISVTGRSRDNIAFKIDKSRPGVMKSFIDHFEKLWKHARIVLD